MGAAVAQQRTPQKQARFLEALAAYGNVTQAAKACGMARRTLYDWRREDAAFAAAWDEASELGANALEDEARRRAFKGTLKPVYQRGEKVGTVREYSDTLLIFLLKGAKPEKYRENVRHSGAIGVNLDLNVPNTPEVAAAARSLLRAADGGAGDAGRSGAAGE